MTVATDVRAQRSDEGNRRRRLPSIALPPRVEARLLGGRGLAHRRRLAWLAALVLLGVSALTHILKGLDIEEATVVLVVAGLLWRAGWLFDAPVPHARWRTLARVIPVVVVLDFAYG